MVVGLIHSAWVGSLGLEDIILEGGKVWAFRDRIALLWQILEHWWMGDNHLCSRQGSGRV